MAHSKPLFDFEDKVEQIKRIKKDRTIEKQMLKFKREAENIDKWLTKKNKELDKLIKSIDL